MTSADKFRAPAPGSIDAQRIAERAVDALVAPDQVDAHAAMDARGPAERAADAPAARAAARNTPDAQRRTERAAEALVAREDLGALTATDAQRLAERAAEALFSRDTTARLLGIRIISASPGGARVAMTVRSDMVNGHSTCHGGLIFTLADTAFAISCNSHNESSVAAAASIDFLAPAFEGDELCAEGIEQWRSGRTGLYEIKVTNQRGELIALFRGRSHRIGGAVTSD